MTEGCIFCRIVSGEIPATIIAEDDACIAFRDLNPQAPVHVLVVPRRHLSSLDAAGPGDADTLGRVALLAARVARDTGIARSGYRTVVNSGADAGQSVFHLHLHLLGGRVLGWPPG